MNSNQPTLLGDLLSKYQPKEDGPPSQLCFGEVNKYISREFQDYGYRLAMELDDEAHKALYIRLAKTVNRALLEQARTFVVDAPNVQNKGKLFMWKLKEIRSKVKV